jgi:hypothetical protein
MEADGADGADGDSGVCKVSEAVKTIRTCQNLSEKNGTHLGLLLLHVGPNGDGFGGQAFMEHYSTCGDNPNTTQTPEYTKDEYNARIIKRKVSPKVSPTTYVGRRIKERRCEGDEWVITNKTKVNDFWSR